MEERRADTHFSASQVAVVQENVVGWNHATRVRRNTVENLNIFK